MKQKLLYAIVKKLVEYLDGYHLGKNGGKKGKKTPLVTEPSVTMDSPNAEPPVTMDPQTTEVLYI